MQAGIRARCTDARFLAQAGTPHRNRLPIQHAGSPVRFLVQDYNSVSKTAAICRFNDLAVLRCRHPSEVGIRTVLGRWPNKKWQYGAHQHDARDDVQRFRVMPGVFTDVGN